MGDKVKGLTTFYCQTFRHPSKKERIKENFSGSSASEKSNESNDSDGNHLLGQNLPPYLYVACFYLISGEWYMLNLSVMYALLQYVPERCTGRQRKLSKVILQCRGRDNEQDFFFTENIKMFKRHK